MSTKRASPRLRGALLALSALVVLLLPVTSSGQTLSGTPTGSVTVCQVTGSAGAPSFLEVQVSVDQVAAYLNQFPGSYVGSCPASSGGDGSLAGAVRVCHVAGSATAPVLSEVLVAVDQVDIFLGQNPGSFVGPCPATSGGGNAVAGGATGPLTGVVTVCRVTGSASVPELAQVTLEVDQVAVFLNRSPRSFVGTCPGKGGAVTAGPGRILGIPAGAALTICQVSGSARVLRTTQVNVAIEQVAAFLNQHPRSFVGLCPSQGDPNGTIGTTPLGYVTVCRVTGDAESPLAAVTIRVEQLAVYLTRAGTVVPAPTTGCPRVSRDTPGSASEQPPSSTTPGETRTVEVRTTPNTVVTARGAGVDTATRSNAKGKATLKVKPKRRGIVTVRAEGGRVVQRLGVSHGRQTAANLTG